MAHQVTKLVILSLFIISVNTQNYETRIQKPHCSATVATDVHCKWRHMPGWPVCVNSWLMGDNSHVAPTRWRTPPCSHPRTTVLHATAAGPASQALPTFLPKIPLQCFGQPKEDSIAYFIINSTDILGLLILFYDFIITKTSRVIKIIYIIWFAKNVNNLTNCVF